MKINAINKDYQVISIQTKPVSRPSIGTQPINMEKGVSIYKDRGYNVTFGITARAGERVIGSNVRGLMAKINVKKETLTMLKERVSSAKSQEVIDAEDIISRYEYWEANSSDLWNKAVSAASAARKREKDLQNGWERFWFPNCGQDQYDAVMNSMYYEKRSHYDVGSYKYSEAKKIVDAYKETLRVSEENRAEQIKLMEETIKTMEDQIDLLSVRDAVNEAMNNTGGINDRIAGYDGLKNEIKRTFINPLIENVKAGNNNMHVPPAVMLYGATGCGKTSMLNAIQSQVKGYARVVDISASDNPDFIGYLNRNLKDARRHYLETRDNSKNNIGERTILILNEAEIYLAADPLNTGVSGMFYNQSDLKKLDNYNRYYDCPKNVTTMKSMLDYISKLPENESSPGCAATIFITSNYPHLIHRDLLSRDGEFGKMLSYAVRPAANNDLKEVIKYYFTKMSNLVEDIKYFAKQENCDDLIDSLTKVSDKGKDVLKEKARNKTIENLSIDPELKGFKNINMFIRGNNPSLVRGAYSNARIENIVKRAFVDYLENPAVPFEKYFFERKNQWGVDITPEAYRQFENICDMVENPEKFKQNQLNEIGEELRMLVKNYGNGEISDKELLALKLKVKDMKQRYKELSSQENLSETEKTIKEQYKDFLDSIQDVEFPD